jgi:serine/threonine protein kinase
MHRDIKPENILITHVFDFIVREPLSSATLDGRFTIQPDS